MFISVLLCRFLNARTAFYSRCVDEICGFDLLGLIFIVLVLIIDIIYWHYSRVISAELMNGDLFL